MKKLLTLIGAITLTTTGAMTLVSCGGNPETGENGENETPIKMTFEELMNSKVGNIFTGEIIFSNSGSMPLNKISIEKLLTMFWIEDTYYEGFLEQNSTIDISADNSVVEFKNFVPKSGHSNKKQILLETIISNGVIHWNDEEFIISQ